MISKVTPSFRRGLRALSKTDRQAAQRAYRLFATEPSHNSLRFKKLAGHDQLWSVRVSLSVRAVGKRDGNSISWVWIGSHGEFDNRFG